MTISHDINGAFVRAAWEADSAGQTETVYALEVRYTDGEPIYYDSQPTPFSDEKIREFRTAWWRDKERTLLSIEPVSRQVTITATDWA